MTTEFTPKQLKLIEKHRDINVDYDWWDSTYADFIERMAMLNITVDAKDIQFSGFWSQGDGASFAGHICYTDMALFMAANDLHLTMPHEYMLACQDMLSTSISTNHCGGNYCHDGVMSCGVERDDWSTGATGWSYDNDPEDDDLRGAMLRVACDAFDNTSAEDSLDQVILEICRAEARQLYKDLEAEHDALTSDEAVWDAIEANELDDEPRCRTEDCDGDPDDGEGWDGYCGNCADAREAVDEESEDA